MAYTPSLKDIEDIQGVKVRSKSYKPSIEDVNDLNRQQYAMGQAQGIGRFLKGLPQGAINLALTPGNAADALISKISGIKPNPIQANFAGDSSEAQLGELLGGAAASLPISGVNVASKAMKGAKTLPALQKYLASIADATATGAGFGAGLNINKGESPLEGAEQGATVGAIGQGALGLVPAAITGGANFYKNNLLKKQSANPELYRSPEEVGNLADRLQGAPANIAELVEHPAAKTFYTDVLGAIPGSGVRPREEHLINKSLEQQRNILEELKGGVLSSDIPSILKNYLSKAAKEKREQTRENFRHVFKNADASGVTLGEPKNFNSVADEIIRKQESGDSKAIPEADLNYIKKLRKNFDTEKTGVGEVIQKSETGIVPEGNNYIRAKADYSIAPSMSLENAHFKRSDIGDELRAAKGNPTLEKAYSKLKEALDKDMSQAINSSNNPYIKELYNDALKFHRNDYLPYKSANIDSLVNNKVDENLAINRLLGSQNKKILEDMPQEIKNLIAFSKLGKGETLEGEIFASPKRTSNLAQQIPASTRRRLLTPDQEQALINLNTLSTASQKAELARNKPPTGYKNMPEAVLGGIGALLGKTSILAAPVANVAAKTMSSNALRDAYINRSPVNQSKLMEEILPEFLKVPRAEKARKALAKPNYLNALLYAINQRGNQ